MSTSSPLETGKQEAFLFKSEPVGRKGDNPNVKTRRRQWQTTSVCAKKTLMITQTTTTYMELDGETLRPESSSCSS